MQKDKNYKGKRRPQKLLKTKHSGTKDNSLKKLTSIAYTARSLTPGAGSLTNVLGRAQRLLGALSPNTWTVSSTRQLQANMTMLVKQLSMVTRTQYTLVRGRRSKRK